HYLVGFKRSKQNQELTDESVRHGHGDTRHRHDYEGDREPRRRLGETTVFRDFARMRAFIDHSDEEEESARADPMVQHLVEPARKPVSVKREEAEHYISHM